MCVGTMLGSPTVWDRPAVFQPAVSINRAPPPPPGIQWGSYGGGPMRPQGPLGCTINTPETPGVYYKHPKDPRGIHSTPQAPQGAQVYVLHKKLWNIQNQ